MGESDAPDVKQQEPRELEGLSGMNPPAAVGPDTRDDRPDEEIELGEEQPDHGEPVTPDAPPDATADEINPGDLRDASSGGKRGKRGLPRGC